MTVRPATTAELSSFIVDAAARGRALRLVGRGTWPDGGAPVDEHAEPLHLDAFSGVIEYEPGDLTITVGAATTIAELDALTAPHGQWCPLAPWGRDEGSVGATIATATAGPLSHALGGPRDLVLGLECVDGTGKALRPGGNLVKNVAGFDLVRLMTGAWGSLGAITRVSLRLRARPAVDETWHLHLETHHSVEVQRAVRHLATPPIACERVGPGHGVAGLADGLLVRLAGNAPYVAAARRALAAFGEPHAVDASVWTDVRAAAGHRAPRVPADPALRALNAAVKQTFDPANVLNPGIMG